MGDIVTLGQSGAEVSFVDHDGKAAIRKSARPGTDSQRLARQVAKHREACARLGALPVGVPQILSPWDEVHSSYVMEYVPGTALGSYFSTSPLRQTREMIDKVIEVLDGLLADAENNGRWAVETNRELMAAKLDDIASRACPVPFGPLVKATVQQLLGALDQLYVPHGWNHGDFSYENLLVDTRSQTCWAIDFLDSPVESPLIDVGRILLDAEHGWWASTGRRSSGEVLSSRQLSRRIRDVASDRGVSASEISAFKMLAALRVLPYTRLPVRKAVLASVLKVESSALQDHIKRTGLAHEPPRRPGSRPLDQIRTVASEVLAPAP